MNVKTIETVARSPKLSSKIVRALMSEPRKRRQQRSGARKS